MINIKDINKPLFDLAQLKNYENIRKYSKIFFYVLFYAYCALSVIYYNSSLIHRLPWYKGHYIKISLILCLIAVIYMVTLSEFSIKQLLGRLILVAILYVSYKHVGTPRVLVGWAIVLSAKFEIDELNKLLRNSWIYLLVFLVIQGFLYLAGITVSANAYRGDFLRWDMGMKYPNTLGGYLLVLCCFYIMYKFKNMKIYDYIIIAAVVGVMWFGVACRTTTILLVLIVLFQLAYRFWGDKLLDIKWIQAILVLLYPFMLVASYFAARWINIDRKILVFIDNILAGRISYGAVFLKEYRFSLWGQRIKTVDEFTAMQTGTPTRILDNAYLRLYINFGALATIIFIAMSVALMWWAIKQKRMEIVAMLVVVALCGMSESYIIYTYFNMFMVLFAFVDNLYLKDSVKQIIEKIKKMVVPN